MNSEAVKSPLSYHSIINLFHVFVVAPVFFYLYYLFRKKALNANVCLVLMTVALLGFVYHANKLYTSKSKWVYLIHILLVFPLLFVIGKNCQNSPRYLFEILLLTAFAAVGYHSFNFIVYN